jgi:hypothetical protein
MPVNNSEHDKRLWAAAGELRANSYKKIVSLFQYPHFRSIMKGESKK